MIDPIDTSRLGPIRVDPNSEQARARIVREALDHWSDTIGESDRVVAAARVLVRAASDQALTKLGRLLK